MNLSKKLLTYALSGLLCFGNVLGFDSSQLSSNDEIAVVSAAKLIWNGN